MSSVTIDFLTQQLELADQLLAGRTAMLQPQGLPGRYGRVVQAIDHLLATMQCAAALGGGWAVWRHGYVGRVTQDMDIGNRGHTQELIDAAPGLVRRRR